VAQTLVISDKEKKAAYTGVRNIVDETVDAFFKVSKETKVSSNSIAAGLGK
jgi:hypothetical protein